MKSLSLKLDLHHSSEKWQKIIYNGSQKNSYYVVQILCKYTKNPTSFNINLTISHKVNPLKTGNNFGLMSSFLKPQISWGGGLPDAEVPAVSVHKKPRAYIFAIF